MKPRPQAFVSTSIGVKLTICVATAAMTDAIGALVHLGTTEGPVIGAIVFYLMQR